MPATRCPSAIGRCSQAGFDGNVLRRLRQFPIAQRPGQIPSEDHALAAPLGHSLFFEEVGALLHGLLGISTKAQVAQPPGRRGSVAGRAK